MPSPKELAKALAYRGEIRNTPQNSFLGAIANFLAPVSEFADRDKLPGSIPLLGGMSFADLSGLKGAESLVRDMSYGKSPVRGATLNTAKVDPRLLDLAAVSGAMIPVGKALGKAALREGARQIETGTGIGRAALDPRMGIVPEGQAMSAPAKQGAMNDGSQDVITYIGRKGQKFQITKQRDNELLDIHSSIADKAREIFGDGVESFDSGMSSSRYVKLPNGAKIRVSDHPLPSDFAAMHGVPDVEVRGGQDLQKAIDYMIDAKSNKTMPNSQKRYDDLSLRDELRSNGVPLFAVDARQIRKLVNSSVGYDDIANQLQQKYPKLTDSDAAKIYTVIGRGKFDKFDSSKTPLRLAHEVAQRNAALPVDQGGMLDNVGGAMMHRPKPAGLLDYQIEHKPMTIEGGAAPLHDLSKSFGEDVYGKNALQYYGSGDARESGTLRLLQSLRGKPDAQVTIYRGAPSEAGGINAGDWVTLDKRVAQDYVDQALASDGKAGKVFSQKVPASHITSWPDSLMEFGYHPK